MKGAPLSYTSHSSFRNLNCGRVFAHTWDSVLARKFGHLLSLDRFAAPSPLGTSECFRASIFGDQVCMPQKQTLAVDEGRARPPGALVYEVPGSSLSAPVIRL